MEIELCIRCGKPTPYDIQTPINVRRYYIEGSGQLCEKCFYELYPIAPSFVLTSNKNLLTIPPKKVVDIYKYAPVTVQRYFVEGTRQL